MREGTLFERAVADIVGAYGNTSDVVQGDWVEGPDGRRDRDVSFTVITSERSYRALIECKDFNPATTGAVGIELVDEFESKCRDLKIDVAMMCSNAGFTQPAMNKARRLTISTIGALRMQDARVKFEVNDLFYTRKITLGDVRFTFECNGPISDDFKNMDPMEFRYDGKLVANWAIERLRTMLAANPMVNGDAFLVQKLKAPITLNTQAGDLTVTQISIHHTISGAWHEHEVGIDATAGLYDWMRHRVQLTGPGEKQFQIKDLNLSGGTWVAKPPDYVLNLTPPHTGEVMMGFYLIHGPQPTGPAPDLNQFVTAEDLNLLFTDIPPDFMLSKVGYRHPGDGTG